MEFKKLVMQKYEGDWVNFFLDWRIQTKQNTQKTISQIKKESIELKEQTIKEADRTINTLLEDNQNLRQQMDKMRDQLQEINQRDLDRMAHEKLTGERRLARKIRERQPLRDPATIPELDMVFSKIDETENSAFIKSRDKVCLLFLYLFGFRTSNLRLLTVKHLLQTLKNKDVVMWFCLLLN